MVVATPSQVNSSKETVTAKFFFSAKPLDSVTVTVPILVEVAPNANPVVCKIMNYGKYKYEQARKEKESKKKQKVVEVKEIRLSSTIDTHDFEFKSKNARKFLEDGNKVKATIKFKGRELNNTAFGANVLTKFAESLEDVGVVDKAPRLEGRSMMLMINPKNNNN